METIKDSRHYHVILLILKTNLEEEEAEVMFGMKPICMQYFIWIL